MRKGREKNAETIHSSSPTIGRRAKKATRSMGKTKSELPGQSKQREAEALKKKQEVEADALKRKQEAEAEQERQRGEKALKGCLEEDVRHMTDSEFYRARFPDSFGGPSTPFVEAISSLKYVDYDRKKAIAMQWAREKDKSVRRWRQRQRRRGQRNVAELGGPRKYLFNEGYNEELRRRGYRYTGHNWQLQHPHKRRSVYDHAPRHQGAPHWLIRWRLRLTKQANRGELRTHATPTPPFQPRHSYLAHNIALVRRQTEVCH